MEYSGFLTKYRINRPLTDKEQDDHLKQNQRLNIEPRYQLCVIKMNSTFLESVDKWFAWKGVISIYMIPIILIFVGGLGFVALRELLMATGVLPLPEHYHASLSTGIILSLIVSCISWFAIRQLRKDSFAYTHYPIRFNRITRMVHVFRANGTVLSVPWDQVYFTMAYEEPRGYAEVRGHVLDADNVTVRETFSLSYLGVITGKFAPFGIRTTDDDFVRANWEFIRRYMEDGPQKLSGQVEFCMPVDARRERLSQSVRRVFANFAGILGVFYVLLGPWIVVFILFRVFAMRTSKIPQWPKEIEANCAIASEDPYAIAGGADGKRVAVFPEAARMAGVAFIAPPGHASS
jgi:hypothetical protein